MIKAIITAYYPSDSVKCHVEKIAAQVDKVYICDNSPVPNKELFAQICDQDKIVHMCFCENLGLSAAFNRVLKDSSLEWNTGDYVFFFDQDSSIQDGHVAQMIRDYEELLRCGYQVGCLGPAYFNTSNQTLEIPKSKTEISEGLYAVGSIITSSMLCRYEDLRAIHFWNEELFLDLADWDICWRMQAHGRLCCLTQNIILHHSLGSGEKKIGPLRLRVGQPLREYYQIRDGMYLFAKKYTPWKFRIRYLAMLTIRSFLHVLFLDRHSDRLKYICKGFVDACRKKKGALPISK